MQNIQAADSDAAKDVADKLARLSIKRLIPYKSARGNMQDGSGITFLDAAENPWSPFEEKQGMALNRYPAQQPEKLAKAFAELYGVRPENISITRGSEEGIRLLLQVFCDPRTDCIITCPPTFAMYPVEAAIHDVQNIQISRTGDFYQELNIDGIVKTAQEKNAKIVFLCNPGNPSSTILYAEQIEAVLQELSGQSIVVVDEAYIEFADQPSFAEKLDQYANLVVLRTLSKSYGLAGLRCGCVIASTAITSYLKRIMLAYPVPVPVIEYAERLFDKKTFADMQKKQAYLRAAREDLIKSLEDCAFIEKIYPSKTNFLCVMVKDVKTCVNTFMNEKIIIRDRSAAITNAINIAVGTEEQNRKVIEIFKRLK